MLNILVIIPARGGSKGIPRKNLRSMNGKPLIFYAIDCARNSTYKPDIFVTSDDEEILMLAKKFGAYIHVRPSYLADDYVTLDPVIYEAYKSITEEKQKNYDIIITLQPTSPLLKSSSLDTAISKMIQDHRVDTIISAVRETHLSWIKEGEKFVPTYKKRLNRQQADPVFKETGGFLIARSSNISSESRIGKNTELYLLSNGEEINIDTYEDWSTCEFLMKRKKILFVVIGGGSRGLGHVYRALIIANQIYEHELYFLVLSGSDVAHDKISEYNYNVHLAKTDNILDDIKRINPDLIVNDILDTSFEYTLALKKLGIKIINFEDTGEGIKNADIVINALYPQKYIVNNMFSGHEYFCARDEFLYAGRKQIAKEVRAILITFGGTDENNLTQKVLRSIYNYCIDQNIKMRVIAGLAYPHYESLGSFAEIEVIKNTRKISEYMLDSDIIFTSAGRTVYEIACLGTPTIVIAQNNRELTHYFAHPEYGFINLGLGERVEEKEILKTFRDLLDSYSLRIVMQVRMFKNDLTNRKKRVISVIKNLLASENL